MSKGGIIIKEVGKEPYFKEIDCQNLKGLQEIVGGYITTVNFPLNMLLVINEEGLIRELPLNLNLAQQPIYGDVVFIGQRGEEFCGLTAEQIKWFLDWWSIDKAVADFIVGV